MRQAFQAGTLRAVTRIASAKNDAGGVGGEGDVAELIDIDNSNPNGVPPIGLTALRLAANAFQDLIQTAQSHAQKVRGLGSDWALSPLPLTNLG